MNQEREPRSSLRELLKPGNFSVNAAPRLRRFRLLQWLALCAAVIWVVVGLNLSHQFIHHQLHEKLQARMDELNNESQFSLRIFDQNLHQAEQLSQTLSFEQSTVNLLHKYRELNLDLNAMELEERRIAIPKIPGREELDSLYKQLATNVDATQIILLDPLGYLIASSRSGDNGAYLGVRYHTREYYQEALIRGKGRQFAIGKQIPVASFYFSTAIKANGELLGIIVIRLVTEEVVDFINPTMDLTLVSSSNGVVLASSDPALVYKHVGRGLSRPPLIIDYQRIFKQQEMASVPFEEIYSQHGNRLWSWQGERHILARGYVEEGDFQVFLFDNVSTLFTSSNTYWNFSFATLLAGLLIIILLERSVNFSQQRKAHLTALFEANRNLSSVSSELYELTVTDALTGLSSRRYFTQRLEDAVQREHRQTPAMPRSSVQFKGLSLLLLDLDRFKLINDTYGHPAGDEAIRSMAKICQEQVRPYDTVGRMGGEEFAILLTDVTIQESKEVAARILHNCETTTIEYEKHQFTQTCSIGIARLCRDQTANGLLSQADKALYAAKNQGRNRFIFF
ncbi:diguanylate cyclase (GGDEF) domain-containing protein [Alteromonadaceae bacterium Bs31]|nr:diguanylate cyclase (GGDEF) domain-containing protein [Alteromonadaceae bacterium Bs31]